MPEHQQIQQSKKMNTIFQKQATPVIQTPVSNPYSIIQRAKINPKSLTHADIMQLQRTIGNQAVGRLLSSIGNTSTAQQETVQRQEIPEEEEPLQGKMIQTIQRQEIPEEEEPLQGKFTSTDSSVQRQEIPEEEEPLQGKMIGTIQRQEIPEKEEPLKGKMVGTVQRQEIPEEEEPLQTKTENNTGMPDSLKAGVESMSGIDMSDVKVHYNSDKPAGIGALAYTQGTNIHVAPGQERHLPHEAWHVVQQKQGRVKPTMQLKSRLINDDIALEREADVMCMRALQAKAEIGGEAAKGLVSSSFVIQRVYAPAAVTAGKNVRLHRYVTGVKEHFLSARVGNQTTDVKSRAIEILHDYDRVKVDVADKFRKAGGCFSADTDYTKVCSQAGNVGYLNNNYFTVSARVGVTNIYAVNVGPQNFQFYDYVNDVVVGNAYSNDYKNEAITILNHMFTAENTNNIEIDKKYDLIKKITDSVSLGSPIDPDMWGQAIGHIQGKIIPRINAEIGNIRAAGLITAHHTLKKIEFTGADFHKHGQTAVFCKFDTDGVIHASDPRTVVYKPGNLAVDTTLFNSANSLASALDNTGTQISTYTLIRSQDTRVGQNNEDFTFMKFVKSDLPTNTADLTGVWASIGANAAMAYLVGLEDMHYDNVLLLRDRIQIIDMEATTGLFKSFNILLLNVAIMLGIRPKLIQAAVNGTLVTGTTPDQCKSAARNAFKAIIDKAQGNAFDAAYAAHRNALAGSRSRLVPIATKDFYFGIKKARVQPDLNAWCIWLAGAGDEYVTRCVGQTGSTKPFILNLLRSAGTYNALFRGDIPYYTRDLGSSNIFDEEGNQIPQAGCSKVGDAINIEMDARRDKLQLFGAGNMDKTAAYAAFNGQIIPLLTNLNDDLNQIIHH